MGNLQVPWVQAPTRSCSNMDRHQQKQREAENGSESGTSSGRVSESTGHEALGPRSRPRGGALWMLGCPPRVPR